MVNPNGKSPVETCFVGVVTAAMGLIILFFMGSTLWLGIFSIPTFFIFAKASASVVLSVTEGTRQLSAVLDSVRAQSVVSLRLGAASGLTLTVIAGTITFAVMETIKFYAFEDLTTDGSDLFYGVFRIIGAVLFTHLGVSIVRIGHSKLTYSRQYQEKLEALNSRGMAGPMRSEIFYLGLNISLREGLNNFVYMIPLGAIYDAKSVPTPAVLGLFTGLLLAHHLVPMGTWDSEVASAIPTIIPDSNARTWGERRDELTNAYVADLAKRAKAGKTVERKDGDGPDLTPDAVKDLFAENDVDVNNTAKANWAAKRLIVLRSSRAFVEDPREKALELLEGASVQEEEGNGNVLLSQSSGPSTSLSGRPTRPPYSSGNAPSTSNMIFGAPGDSSKFNSSRIFGDEPMPPRLTLYRGDSSSRRTASSMIGPTGHSLVSICEDEEGYYDRGGYYYDDDDELEESYQEQVSQRFTGSSVRAVSLMWKAEPSVRASGPGFSEGYQKMSMDAFQHRNVSRMGPRDPEEELQVMDEHLADLVAKRKENVKDIRPSSPPNTAPHPGSVRFGSQFAANQSRKDSLVLAEAGIVDNSYGNGGRSSREVDTYMPAPTPIMASIVLLLSSLLLFLCSAGLTKLGILNFQEASSSVEGTLLWNICSCCTPDEDGDNVAKIFEILEDQLGYACRETLTGLIAWLAYWICPATFVLYSCRMLCFKNIPAQDVPLAIANPSRRGGMPRQHQFRESQRHLKGNAPDPSRIGRHSTHVWIKLSAILNFVSGILYIRWRAVDSMPDDPVAPVWNWFFFGGEVILLIGVWTSHFQRMFPAIRDVCTMDDLVEIDSSLDKEALVCIMVPTAGEKMKNLKDVILGAYSQRLWASSVPANKQLRVAILDEKGRHEVLELAEKVYNLAMALSIPAVQADLCQKLNEPSISPKIFMDYFNQMDALDKYVFPKKTHMVFDLALLIDKYTGTATNKLARASSSSTAGKGKSAATTKKERLPEGHKVLFDQKETIPSMIYSARASPGTPKVSPKAGNMNAAIFPSSPGEEPVVGSAAKVVVVNDARHRLKSDFIQRTVPYFFKLDKASNTRYDWADVGFVQVPQRFADLGDNDPLGNHAVMTFFIANVSKDGVGGVTSCGQGSIWRCDALRGMAANGEQVVFPDDDPSIIGHDCGFRAEVLIEDTHTSLELFKKQWRSAYVCEYGETLAICVEQPNSVAWRVKQVFRWHLGAVQLLLKDGLGFICTSKMPTPLHKMFGVDSLTYYIQAVGGMFILFMPIAFSISQETPFDPRGLNFLYYFMPFIITSTIPTLLSVGWKNVNPTRVLTDEQFWLSTCYVQVWAFVLGFWNRITCASPDNAWNLVCPVWPLAFLFWALGVSAINTTVHWAYVGFDGSDRWIWMASFGACLVGMFSIWPMVKLWWPGWPSLPNAYHQKFVLILLFIVASSVLATYFS